MKNTLIRILTLATLATSLSAFAATSKSKGNDAANPPPPPSSKGAPTPPRKGKKQKKAKSSNRKRLRKRRTLIVCSWAPMDEASPRHATENSRET